MDEASCSNAPLAALGELSEDRTHLTALGRALIFKQQIIGNLCSVEVVDDRSCQCYILPISLGSEVKICAAARHVTLRSTVVFDNYSPCLVLSIQALVEAFQKSTFFDFWNEESDHATFEISYAEEAEHGMLRLMKHSEAFIHIQTTLKSTPEDVITDFLLTKETFYRLWRVTPDLALEYVYCMTQFHITCYAGMVLRSVTSYLENLIFSLSPHEKSPQYFTLLEHFLASVGGHESQLLEGLKDLNLVYSTNLWRKFRQELKYMKLDEGFAALIKLIMCRAFLSRNVISMNGKLRQNPAFLQLPSPKLKLLLTSYNWEHLTQQSGFPKVNREAEAVNISN